MGLSWETPKGAKGSEPQVSLSHISGTRTAKPASQPLWVSSWAGDICTIRLKRSLAARPIELWLQYDGSGWKLQLPGEVAGAVSLITRKGLWKSVTLGRPVLERPCSAGSGCWAPRVLQNTSECFLLALSSKECSSLTGCQTPGCRHGACLLPLALSPPMANCSRDPSAALCPEPANHDRVQGAGLL